MNAMKHLFVLNPKSFWHKWKWEQVLFKIHSFFNVAGHKNCALHVSRFPRDAIGFIRSFGRNLPEETTLRVYAVGGDGILFDCLNGIMGLERAELAVIPYGHTNNFIRSFGKSAKAQFRDIERLLTAPVIPLDIIRCGDMYAINYCNVGAEAEAVRIAENLRENMNKGGVLSQWMCRCLYKSLYYIAGISACLDKKLLYQQYEVNVDGETTLGTYRGLAILNGSYFGGNMHPVSNAMPNDGMLEILIARSQGILRTYSLLPFYVTGRSSQFAKDYFLMRGQKISVNSEAPILFSMDDIVFFDTKLTLELLPAALKFVDASLIDYQGETNQ